MKDSKDKNHSQESPAEEVSQTAAEPQNKEQELREQLLRFRADFENTKKRLERDKLDAIKFANERLLAEILPIVDNLDRAVISLSEGHDPEKVKTGLKIAQEEIHKILELHGVQVVKSLGEEFDPQVHEAVAVVETPDSKDGMIVDEIQRGYVLNGRLIRPSRVRIAKKLENNKQNDND